MSYGEIPILEIHGCFEIRKIYSGKKRLVFVGVHIRRTDYAHHLAALYGGKGIFWRYFITVNGFYCIVGW